MGFAVEWCTDFWIQNFRHLKKKNHFVNKNIILVWTRFHFAFWPLERVIVILICFVFGVCYIIIKLFQFLYLSRIRRWTHESNICIEFTIDFCINIYIFTKILPTLCLWLTQIRWYILHILRLWDTSVYQIISFTSTQSPIHMLFVKLQFQKHK